MSQLCNLIVIDNFYKNPMDVRNFALNEEYSVSGNYPGVRTKSYATYELKELIQKYIGSFGGKITDFPMESSSYNGSFQYTTSRASSWIHTDPYNTWGGVLYLTPDAPVSSGTAFYKIKETTDVSLGMYENTIKKDYVDYFSQDLTKWELVDTIGNVFNRLVLFNSKRYHMSMDYFGTDKTNGRLFQVFFFSTENKPCDKENIVDKLTLEPTNINSKNVFDTAMNYNK